MARALIASFGFDEKFVVRAIIRHGIGTGDLVLLVTGKPADKTLQAYRYVEEVASKVDAQVQLHQLDNLVYDFPALVAECRKLLEKTLEEYEHVTILLSGGMRVIVLGLYTATLLLPHQYHNKLTLELDTEDTGTRVEIPTELLRLFTTVELGAKQQLLKAIAENQGLGIRELARLLGKDESTIRRQLQALEELGLVRLEGRPQKVYTTPAAKTLL